MAALPPARRPAWRSALGPGMVGLWLATAAGAARGDRGDVTVGARLGAVGLSPAAATLGAQVELGLSPWWATMAELTVEPPLGRPPAAGQLVAGATWLYDVAVWVPHLSLAAGLRRASGRLQPSLLGRAGVRYFLAPRLQLGLALGGWWTAQGLRPELALQLGWQPAA